MARITPPNLDVASCTTGELHVYADGTSGDDANDGLSAAAPKKTLAAVFALVPDIVKHNTCIHLTGTFALTSSPLLQPHSVYFDPNYKAALLIDGGNDVTIVDDNGGSNYTADIHSAVTIGTTGAGWGVDAFRGYWVEVLSGAHAGSIFSIQSNTADTIYPMYYWSGDVGAVSYRIVRPATTITSASTAAIQVFCSNAQGSIQIQHLYFSGKAYLSLRGPIYMSHVIVDNTASSAVWMTGIPHFSYGGGFMRNRYSATTFSLLTGEEHSCGLSNLGASLVYVYAATAQFNSVSAPLVRIAAIPGLGECFLYGTRIDAVEAYDVTPSKPETISANFKGNSSVKVRLGGGASPGLSMIRSSLRVNDYVDISDCSTHAIVCERSTLLMTTAAGAAVVTGSGNTGAGVYAHSGSVVHIKDGSPPTLTGAVGDLSTDGTTEAVKWSTLDAGVKLADADEFVLAKEV